MACERPPAAFGGSPPREGETRAKRARGSLTHHLDLQLRNRPVLQEASLVFNKLYRYSFLLALLAASATTAAQQQPPAKFHLQEAGIAAIQQSILTSQITTVGLVELYLKRIKTYNGTCVNEPMGILGPITTIPHAKQINALSTLNLRPTTRKVWGFAARNARCAPAQLAHH